jgi:hypothetical protein
LKAEPFLARDLEQDLLEELQVGLAAAHAGGADDQRHLRGARFHEGEARSRRICAGRTSDVPEPR